MIKARPAIAFGQHRNVVDQDSDRKATEAERISSRLGSQFAMPRPSVEASADELAQPPVS